MSASPAGGLTRIDLAPDGSGCQVVWSNTLQSAATPKFSVADTFIYTIEREPPDGASSTASFAYAAVDPESGATPTGARVASGAFANGSVEMGRRPAGAGTLCGDQSQPAVRCRATGIRWHLTASTGRTVEVQAGSATQIAILCPT